MKKSLTVTLCLALLLSMLTGCANVKITWGDDAQTEQSKSGGNISRPSKNDPDVDSPRYDSDKKESRESEKDESSAESEDSKHMFSGHVSGEAHVGDDMDAWRNQQDESTQNGADGLFKVPKYYEVFQSYATDLYESLCHTHYFCADGMGIDVYVKDGDKGYTVEAYEYAGKVYMKVTGEQNDDFQCLYFTVTGASSLADLGISLSSEDTADWNTRPIKDSVTFDGGVEYSFDLDGGSTLYAFVDKDTGYIGYYYTEDANVDIYANVREASSILDYMYPSAYEDAEQITVDTAEEYLAVPVMAVMATYAGEYIDLFGDGESSSDYWSSSDDSKLYDADSELMYTLDDVNVFTVYYAGESGTGEVTIDNGELTVQTYEGLSADEVADFNAKVQRFVQTHFN